MKLPIRNFTLRPSAVFKVIGAAALASALQGCSPVTTAEAASVSEHETTTSDNITYAYNQDTHTLSRDHTVKGTRQSEGDNSAAQSFTRIDRGSFNLEEGIHCTETQSLNAGRILYVVFSTHQNTTTNCRPIEAGDLATIQEWYTLAGEQGSLHVRYHPKPQPLMTTTIAPQQIAAP